MSFRYARDVLHFHTALCTCSVSGTSSPESSSCPSSSASPSASSASSISVDDVGEAPAGKINHRWALHMRVIMVEYMTKHLTPDEKKGLRDPSQAWPNHPTRMNRAYSELGEALLREQEETLGRKLKEHEHPSKRAIKEAAKRWTRTFLQDGHVMDKPPHKKNYKIERNMEHLRAIRDMILEGYPDNHGNTRLYRDLHHLQRVKGEEFKVHFDACKVKTMRGLWNQLRTLFPALHKVAIRLKKTRANGLVRVCLPAQLLELHVDWLLASLRSHLDLGYICMFPALCLSRLETCVSG